MNMSTLIVESSMHVIRTLPAIKAYLERVQQRCMREIMTLLGGSDETRIALMCAFNQPGKSACAVSHDMVRVAHRVDQYVHFQQMAGLLLTESLNGPHALVASIYQFRLDRVRVQPIDAERVVELSLLRDFDEWLMDPGAKEEPTYP